MITPGPIYVGDEISYSINITNSGNSNATDVVVTDIVKGPGVIVSCVDNNGKSYTGSVWTIDSIGNHSSIILTVVVRVTSNGTIANNVTANSKENDTNVSDETPDEDVLSDVKLKSWSTSSTTWTMLPRSTACPATTLQALTLQAS